MLMIKTLMALAVVGMLGACAGTTASVDNAGTTTIDVTHDENGNVNIHAVTGKEYDSVQADIDLQNGTGSFSATNARGLQAQLAAAEVEKRFAEFYENATPEAAAALQMALQALIGLPVE